MKRPKARSTGFPKIPGVAPIGDGVLAGIRSAAARAEAETSLRPQTKEDAREGRPPKYRAEFVDVARRLTQVLGSTDREVAAFLGIDDSTLYRWKHTHPEFCEALKTGKDVSDDRVEHSLYRRAVGYSHDAVKVFNNNGESLVVPYTEHYPPDTTAAIFWLKNRRPAEWRERIEKDIRSVIMVSVDQMTPEEREQRALALAQKAITLIEQDG